MTSADHDSRFCALCKAGGHVVDQQAATGDRPVATTRDGRNYGVAAPVQVTHRWREGHVPPTVTHDDGDPCGWCDQ